MSRVPCNFCAHGNPEGSRFCSECGSQLNLTLCSRCEAINSVSAEQCFQCGTPLSSATTGEMTTPPVALRETAQSAEIAPTKGDLVPVALAEPLEALPGDPHVVLHEPQATVEDEPSLAAALTADLARHDDDGPSSPPDAGRATYPGRNPNRTGGFLLLVVFVAVAGAVYWMSVTPTHPPDPRTMTGGAPTTAPEPASSAPAAAPRTADAATESQTEGSLPSPAGSSESFATAGESTSPSAMARPSTAASSESPATISPRVDAEPPAAGEPPERAHAQAPSPAKAAESLDHGTAKTRTANARATNEPRRTVTRDQTKEQAERDAIATRRLIARELADFPPANSDDRSPPRP